MADPGTGKGSIATPPPADPIVTEPIVTPVVTEPTAPTVDYEAKIAELEARATKSEKEAADAEKAKTKSETEQALKDLDAASPKLAKMHKDSPLDTLKTVLSTFVEVNKGFPSLDKDNDTPKIADAANHDTMDYDFSKAAKGEDPWVYT